MAKGMYHYIREAWKKPSPEILKARMTEWRRSLAITRVEKPLRLDKARALGYKAKPGFVVVRVRLLRGGRKRPARRSGRRSKRQTIHKTLMMNYRWVAEQRAARKFPNLELLNSYWLGKDGMHYFYEAILVDPQHPQIRADPSINWICSPKNRGRAFRGLTSAGKKARGLRAKGKKAQF